MAAGADSLTVLEDIIAREGIDCGLHKTGRFVGAWTPQALRRQATQGRDLNKYANAGASMVPRERQRDEIASRLLLRRHGGRRAPATCIRRSTTRACSRPAAARGVAILCAEAAVERIDADGDGLARADRRGDRSSAARSSSRPTATPATHAAAEAPRRAGGEPHHRHRGAARRPRRASLIPRCARSSDTKRVLCYYRHVARRQAHDLRRPRPLHAGRRPK